MVSSGQATYFLCYAWTLGLWLWSEFLHRTSVHHQHADEEESKLLPETEKSADGGAKIVSSIQSKGMLQSMADSGLVRCMLFNRDAVAKARPVLRAMAEFGSLMFWFYVCDRTSVFLEGGKSYNRDLFMFLFLILTLVAFGASLQTVKAPLLLNRNQTEEWKGWMQVLFLLYHYFEAKEIYNAIRVFIAAYVWMTGYGNFSYYYKTGDFGIGRFAQMLWRLNFMVFFACLLLGNSYMLYYICPMHTIYTITVYASLAIAPQLNQSNFWIWVKLLFNVGFVLVFWDIRPVFNFVWTPFTWLVGYTDPRKPSDDVLYEWHFRSSLDRFIWIFGMLCAFVNPQATAALKWVEELPKVKQAGVRTAIIAVCGVVGYFWYAHVYTLPKVEYNAIHPYTSWIPITLWIILRNFTPTLRLHHMRLYGWLGCITLETYIGQFHIWMKSVVPDGQPKALLDLIPEYPMLNFALCTAIYIFVSHRIFDLTNTLKNSAVPHNCNSLLLRNTLLLGSVGLVLYLTVYGSMTLFNHIRP